MEVTFSLEYLEDNLNKFINNETIAEDDKLIFLQNVLWRVEKHKPCHERQLKVATQTSESYENAKTRIDLSFI